MTKELDKGLKEKKRELGLLVCDNPLKSEDFEFIGKNTGGRGYEETTYHFYVTGKSKEYFINRYGLHMLNGKMRIWCSVQEFCVENVSPTRAACCTVIYKPFDKSYVLDAVIEHLDVKKWLKEKQNEEEWRMLNYDERQKKLNEWDEKHKVKKLKQSSIMIKWRG